jgi:hypothetical protein
MDEAADNRTLPKRELISSGNVRLTNAGPLYILQVVREKAESTYTNGVREKTTIAKPRT